MSRNQSRTMRSTWTVRRFAVLGSSSTSAAARVGAAGATQEVLVWAISTCVRDRVLVSPCVNQPSRRHRAETHGGGGGCAPAEHVPSAAACWADRAISHACLVANADQQTRQWRPPSASSEENAERMPDQLTWKITCSQSAASKGSGKNTSLEKHLLRERRLPRSAITSQMVDHQHQRRDQSRLNQCAHRVGSSKDIRQ